MDCMQGPEARALVKTLWQPVLELTHNHGTESDETFKYHNGNDPPQGFGHIGFLCDDLERACLELESAGVPFKKRPQVLRISPLMCAASFIHSWVISLVLFGVSNNAVWNS